MPSAILSTVRGFFRRNRAPPFCRLLCFFLLRPTMVTTEGVWGHRSSFIVSHIPVPRTLLSSLPCLRQVALCRFLSLYSRSAAALRYGSIPPFWIFRRLRCLLLRGGMVKSEDHVKSRLSFIIVSFVSCPWPFPVPSWYRNWLHRRLLPTLRLFRQQPRRG